MIKIVILLISTILTFIYGVWKAKNYSKKGRRFLLNIKGYQLHHSILGLIIMVIPLIKFDIIYFWIGLGIFIGHGLEHIFLGEKNLKAFFIFFTKL
jgi:hypothetical protein